MLFLKSFFLFFFEGLLKTFIVSCLLGGLSILNFLTCLNRLRVHSYFNALLSTVLHQALAKAKINLYDTAIRDRTQFLLTNECLDIRASTDLLWKMKVYSNFGAYS